MKQVFVLCLLAFSCVTHAQEKGPVKAEEAPKAFATKIAGNTIDVFAPGFKMDPAQRFEPRFIFDVARDHCLKSGWNTKLVGHEPAFFAMKDRTISGSLFKYRCGR